MKSIALILAMLVSTLALKPALDAMSTQLISIGEFSCCAVSCGAFSDDASSSDDGDCNGKTCNVFGTCSAVALQITDITELVLEAKGVSASEAPSTYKSVLSSRYISDCWHPPRFV